MEGGSGFDSKKWGICVMRVLWNREGERIFVRIRRGQSEERERNGTEHTAKKRKYNKSSGRAVSGSCEYRL